MKPKTTTVLYWLVTGPFAAFMLMAGVVELLQGPEGREIMRHLGYPNHVLLVLGLGKTLGALALLQPWLRTLKEWAYAGFTFNFLGACVARYYGGDSTGLVVSPLLFLAFMAASYAMWKQRERQRAARTLRVATLAPQPLAA
jgi:hypothetical protein